MERPRSQSSGGCRVSSASSTVVGGGGSLSSLRTSSRYSTIRGAASLAKTRISPAKSVALIAVEKKSVAPAITATTVAARAQSRRSKDL